MEPQKYYALEYGLYCVHFPNKRGLSIEEITSICSEFGEVVTVAKAGDDYGYRFVKYRNEDEAIRCVEGLRNNQFIKLKVKDPNFKKNRNQNNNNQTNNYYGQKNYEHNNGQRNDFSDRNRPGFSTPGADKTANDNKKQYINNNNSTPQAEHRQISLGEQRINDARKGIKNVYDQDVVSQKLHKVQETHPEPLKSTTSLRRPAIASESSTPVHAKLCRDNVNNSSIADHGISSGLQNTAGEVLCDIAQNLSAADPSNGPKGIVPCLEPDNTVENIPRLVMKNSADNTAGDKGGQISPCAAGADTPKTRIAEQVVVANIHSDFGVNYIIHLFQKHDPLSVSGMKIVPSLGLRFCIVYLQSLHQAYAIEKEFDKFNLSGKNLIVLRSERLAELSA